MSEQKKAINMTPKELDQWLGEKGELYAALALGYAEEAPHARPRKAYSDVVEWRT